MKPGWSENIFTRDASANVPKCPHPWRAPISRTACATTRFKWSALNSKHLTRVLCLSHRLHSPYAVQSIPADPHPRCHCRLVPGTYRTESLARGNLLPHMKRIQNKQQPSGLILFVESRYPPAPAPSFPHRLPSSAACGVRRTIQP